MIISAQAGKAFDRIQNLFLIRTLSKLGIEKNFLSLKKGIQVKGTGKIILNHEG